MQVGDKRTEKVSLGDCQPLTKTGTVVYIHPARRFYVVEFGLGAHKAREAYYFPARGGTNGQAAPH